MKRDRGQAAREAASASDLVLPTNRISHSIPPLARLQSSAGDSHPSGRVSAPELSACFGSVPADGGPVAVVVVLDPPSVDLTDARAVAAVDSPLRATHKEGSLGETPNTLVRTIARVIAPRASSGDDRPGGLEG